MKYIRVKVARSETTDLFIKVNEDFQVKDIFHHKYQSALGRIAEETTCDADWDKYGWEEDLQVLSCAESTPEEAEQFQTASLQEYTEDDDDDAE